MVPTGIATGFSKAFEELFQVSYVPEVVVVAWICQASAGNAFAEVLQQM